ncbi:hypothetical protein [Lactobacillus jensenii]|uniref:Uncharacterized protein n=1 Tax=Lactobacillus jensenii TaxID=109790 RepID=A0A5N1IH44_LACJE|nr:hypothetical protein [Lactobacillus jensenii]ERJ44139.1 hypothetical protein N581_07895 [Lactobacillus jensenii MD IIE-70(2)]KAA9324446.1 hypothetical protein F6H94_00330 [Lactobacillus jensenii]
MAKKLEDWLIKDLRWQAGLVYNSVLQTIATVAFQLVDVVFTDECVDFVFYCISDKTFKLTISYNNTSRNNASVFDKDYQSVFKDYFEEKIAENEEEVNHDREKDED